MTYVEYVIFAEQLRANYKYWRKGQVYFNALYRVAPDIADRYRHTELNPFYNDTRLGKFLENVERELSCSPQNS